MHILFNYIHVQTLYLGPYFVFGIKRGVWIIQAKLGKISYTGTFI